MKQTNPSPRRKPGEPSRDCKGAEQANPSPRRKPGEPSRARKGAETGEVPSGIKSPFEQAPHTTNPPPPKRICPNRPRMFKCNHRRRERHRNRAPPPGPIAQRLEQSTHNRLVRGSNPCGPIPGARAGFKGVISASISHVRPRGGRSSSPITPHSSQPTQASDPIQTHEPIQNHEPTQDHWPIQGH